MEITPDFFFHKIKYGHLYTIRIIHTIISIVMKNKAWLWNETTAHYFYIMLQGGGHKSIIVFYCAINLSNRTFKYAKDCCRTRLDAFSHNAFHFSDSFESDLLLI